VTDPTYERYKDALRRGHVAALRGRLEPAIEAYTEAAEIAPDRALPHASLGSVLLKLGRHDEALAAYDAALSRAPRDETALAGRAEVLAELRRRVEAADTLDLLAGIQEKAGRLPDACDTARRALELAESRSRRRLVERLVRSLRETPADAAAVAALDRAMGVLEPVGFTALPARDASPTPEGDAPPEPATVPEAEAEPVVGTVLAAEAEELLDAGDSDGARDRLLAAAAAHRAVGETNAALDACYLALSIAPADVDVHLALAALYLDRGWRVQATDKLLLLDRLADLAGDEDGHDRILALVLDRAADEPRLGSLRA
jgi:tetratricopeptide (TPR) repeat protein